MIIIHRLQQTSIFDFQILHGYFAGFNEVTLKVNYSAESKFSVFLLIFFTLNVLLTVSKQLHSDEQKNNC